MVISLIILVILNRVAECKKLKPVEIFELQVKVNLTLNMGPLLAQVRQVQYPGVYETTLYAPVRVDSSFFTIEDVILGNEKIYEGSESLINRYVYYFVPRIGMEIVHIYSCYWDSEVMYENIEFIKVDNMDNFVENIPELVHVDLRDLNVLHPTIEVRWHQDNYFELFISDLFKGFFKIGLVKYGNFIIDDLVHFCYYRSLSCKFEYKYIYVNVLNFLRNGKRAETKYRINTEAESDDERKEILESRVYFLSRLITN